MQPEYPVFIPTKGRWESRLTIRSFENIGIPFRAVVEPQEYDDYAKVVGPENLLTLPFSNRGLVAARNWIWDYARDSGAERFWTFDDNIGCPLREQGMTALFRFNKNLKVPCGDGTPLRVIEQFAERYENLPIAGMSYFMFAKRKFLIPPFIPNTRVYSNMLIETNFRDPHGKPYRNEGFYNDDTDLCLRILKDGFCTALFNAFLIFKQTTMTVSGGMTPHYQQTGQEIEDDGRYKMAKELRDKHPDVVKITRKWNRWQHHVDYSQFRKNKLIRKPGIVVPEGVNNFGMELRILGEIP